MVGAAIQRLLFAGIGRKALVRVYHDDLLPGGFNTDMQQNIRLYKIELSCTIMVWKKEYCEFKFFIPWI